MDSWVLKLWKIDLSSSANWCQEKRLIQNHLQLGKFPRFDLFNYPNCIVKLEEKIQNCDGLPIFLLLILQVETITNCNIKLENL